MDDIDEPVRRHHDHHHSWVAGIGPDQPRRNQLMRKDLIASLTSKTAIGVAAVLLTAGTGRAVVFHNISDSSSPPHSDKASDTADDHAGEDHPTTTTTAGGTVNQRVTTNANPNSNNDSHGDKVSAAA